MKRLCVLLAAGAIAIAGCSKKKEDDNAKKEPAKEKIQHGKQEGKGTGGGDKTATGSMNGKPGSGKASGSGTGTASGSGGGGGGGGPMDDPQVARGAYLATGAAACALCHTPFKQGEMAPDTDKAFAGGLEFPDTFGTWRSLNITNDPDTGIGKWTDDQVIAAIRQGVTPDGKVLHPIMPWPFYNKMTDDDAKAIVAFLRKAVPPVNNKVEMSTDLERPPQGMPAPSGNTDPTDDPVKHGEYLATLMHCAACHTPYVGEGKAAHPDMTKAWSGGMKMDLPPMMGSGYLYTPNLTSDEETGLGKWSEADIVKALRTLTRPDGRPIVGPMQFYVNMWANMTDEDIAAVAKYIKSIPAIKNKVPESKYTPPGPPPGGGAAPPIEHGKQEGKGTGGGDKAATGKKDGTKGSGKPADAPK